MSAKDFDKRMRNSKETARQLIFRAAARVYEEAGRPYGDSEAGLRAWYLEGGYEEQAARRRGGR